MEIPTNTEYLMYSSSRNKRSVRWFIFSNLIKCFSWVKILYLYLVLHFDLNFLRLLKMIGLFLDISSSFRAMYFLSSSILRSLILFCSAVFILLSPVIVFMIESTHTTIQSYNKTCHNRFLKSS